MSTISGRTSQLSQNSVSSRRFKSARLRRRQDRHQLLLLIEKGNEDEVAEFVHQERSFLTKVHLDRAIHLAASLGFVNICKHLLGAGADINVQEDPQEHEDRHMIVDTFSLAQGQGHAWQRSHTAVGGSPLHRAVEGMHLSCVKLLLSKGARVNDVDQNGVTPLMLAAMRRGSVEMLQYLTFMPGCKIEVRDKKTGRTAMHHAAHAGDPQVLQHLINQGADVDVNDEVHNTPVHLACSPSIYDDPKWPPRQALQCLHLLVERGCFVNLFNINGETPLHKAVELGDEVIIDYLLEHNALVYPDLIRMAALTHKSPTILYNLLEQCSRFDEELLVAILIVIIVSEASKWMINSVGREELDHKIAAMLIKRIYNFAPPIQNLLLMDEYELKNVCGLDHFDKLTEDVAQDLQYFGLFGLALKYGKISIGRMLYLSACSPCKSFTLNIDEPFMFDLLCHPRIKKWLTRAITQPLSLKLLCRQSIRNIYRDEAFIVVPDDLLKFIELNDLDEVKPHDFEISSERERTLDVNYSDRERSKAAAYKTLWLYQTNWSS